jgi:photosystem II stability/assembly factor-like uncharacterized protein
MNSKNADLKVMLMIWGLVLAVLACSFPSIPSPTPDTQATETGVPATVQSVAGTPVGISPTPMPDLPLIANPSLTRITMVDLLNGWGLTETKLVRTADGGLTWYDVTPAGVTSLGYSASVFFLSPERGWVVIPGADFTTGTLLYTVDGGLTWTSLAVPFGGGQMDFINTSTGFILVGRGAGAGSSAVDVYSTSDGGASWEPVFVMQPGGADNVNTLPFSGQKSGFAFLDGSHGWVGGSIPMEGYVYLYSSQDGGHVWVKQELSLPAGFDTAMTEVMSPRFFSATDGILPVRLLAQNLAYDFYVTHDGGATWASTSPVNSNGQIAITSLTDLFVWDGGPVLQVSRDGGQNWTPLATNVNVVDILSTIQFVDTQTGWMLTGDAVNHHTLYKTVDGGANWNILIP